MGYTVETRAGKTGPINRVPPTPRVGDVEPGGKRTVNATAEVRPGFSADRYCHKAQGYGLKAVAITLFDNHVRCCIHPKQPAHFLQILP